jgi:hypothetical protein
MLDWSTRCIEVEGEMAGTTEVAVVSDTVRTFRSLVPDLSMLAECQLRFTRKRIKGYGY